MGRIDDNPAGEGGGGRDHGGGSVVRGNGLCKRWGITSSNHVEDQQEKSWVVEVLTAKGAVALGPLRRYMKGAPQLSHALAVVTAIADRAQMLEVADELLADEKPGYTRDPERRLDVIRWLAEWKDGGADATRRLVPYLKDFDQNVRVAAADAIADADPALTAEALLAAFLRPEEESGRFRKRIAEILAKHKHPLGEHAATVASLLTGPVAGFAVTGGLLIER